MADVKRVIWFSHRHAPAQAQVEELQRLWPGCEVIHVSSTWHSAEALIEKYHELQGDEMATVLPLTIVKRLADKGYRQLVSRMTQVFDTRKPADIIDNNDGRVRRYRFHGFDWIVGVNIERVPVRPELSGAVCLKCAAEQLSLWRCVACDKEEWGCNCPSMKGWPQQNLCEKCLVTGA